jgi:hypothetical protein
MTLSSPYYQDFAAHKIMYDGANKIHSGMIAVVTVYVFLNFQESQT